MNGRANLRKNLHNSMFISKMLLALNKIRHIQLFFLVMNPFFETIASIKLFLTEKRYKHQTIGFVPTMGALHEGHLALIARAAKENDWVVCSIFVNPTQFNNLSDLAKYPRTLEEDKKLLANFENVIIFAPSSSEIYPLPTKLAFSFGMLETVMEGKFRPGHFNGVALVVSKLFHIIEPNKAYFGQKDLQQCLIIKQLIDDLSFDIDLVICPTLRETDGLAMSSRNVRLSPTERQIATIIPKVLYQIRDMIKKGIYHFEEMKSFVLTNLMNYGVRLEYFEIVDTNDLQDVDISKESAQIAICIAAFVGEVRLIDNLIIDIEL